ncbi:restriction endonuclease subunit S [uncultured Dialister sp.]|jgi:type I restriction enzyme S subunit|uniref:restriction endonuclease subunit S n=1 Tax=uncultured Dialister sp. TaxID=278064 RepID=UPI0025FCDE4C|nr:restriction endonuclease subunit S [uncultured Dialister sp.]
MNIGTAFILIRNGASIKQIDGAGGIPITRIETIANKVIDRNRMGYANIYNEDKYSSYFLRDGDILMSHINSIQHLGKVAIYHPKNENEKIIHGMNLLVLRANQKLMDNQFAYFYFSSESFLRKLPRITKKSVNQASFTVSELKKIDIPCPPLSQQRRIANILSIVQNLCDKRNQQLRTFDELVKSRFLEMFGDPAVNSKKLPVVKLGDIAFITKLAGFEYTKYIKYQDHGDIIMVRGLNCKSGKLVLDDIYWIDKSVSDLLPRSKLAKGDIVMTYVGTVGEVAIVDKDDTYHLAPNVAKISLYDKKTNNPYFWNYMFTISKNYILRFASTTTQSALGMEKIRKIPFIVPETEDQNRFVGLLTQVDKSKYRGTISLHLLEDVSHML